MVPLICYDFKRWYLIPNKADSILYCNAEEYKNVLISVKISRHVMVKKGTP